MKRRKRTKPKPKILTLYVETRVCPRDLIHSLSTVLLALWRWWRTPRRLQDMWTRQLCSLHPWDQRSRTGGLGRAGLYLSTLPWEAPKILRAYAALVCWCIHLIIIQGLFDGDSPFFPNGMKIASSAIGDHGARIETSSLAIVELILEKLPAAGSPGEVLFNYLRASFASNTDDLKFYRCAFNIDPTNLGIHQQEMGSIVTSLKKYVFAIF